MAAFTSHATPSKASPRKKSDKIMISKKGKVKENPTKSPAKSKQHAPLWDGKELPWEWASITSPAASKVPPVFTKDGSYFFSLVGSSVQIYSVATGQIVSTLMAPREKSPEIQKTNDSFSCAIVNPHNPFQLITGSLDGCLMIWDFLDGTLLRTIDVAQPVHLICAHELFRDHVFVAVSRPSSKTDNNAVILRVSLTIIDSSTNFTSLRSADISPVGKTRLPTGLAISANGAWLVATAGHKVYVAKTSALAAGFTKYVSPERLTCLAFHPSEEYFATGDDKGVIRLWYCLNDDLATQARGVEKKTQTSAMHWHAHTVTALEFTGNGAYLLSGGEEAVLVIWQLHTGKKEFVPRVGSTINTISLGKAKGGEEEYLLGLADATYVFVNAASLKISRSYSRVKIDPAAYVSDPSPSKALPTPLAVHTLSSTVLLPSSHPSSLQIYSPSTSALISELEVSPSNRVSRRDEKPIEHSRVEHCVISSSGLWMATVDVRDGDSDSRTEVYLKLWSWNTKTRVWTLNTRIDKPHGDKKISSLVFNPCQVDDMPLQMVTVGGDGIVKVWKVRSRKLKNGEREEFWVARATLKYRNEKPRSLAWSYDGSLLAVTYESCVVVYETSIYAVLQTVMSPECTDPRAVHFVGAGGRNMLVSGESKLVLWDIIGQNVLWHCTTNNIQSITPHPSGSSFSVFEQLQDGAQTRVSTFSVESPTPIHIHSLPFGLRTKAWYPNVTQPAHYSFLGINTNWSLVAFGDSVSLSKEDVSTKEISSDATVHKPTLLQDIFGASAFSGLTEVPLAPAQSKYSEVAMSTKSADEIFEHPAYMTPALDVFYDSLIHTYLKKTVAEISSSPIPDPMDMDVDEEETVEDEKQVVNINVSARAVTAMEIKDLVGLFRQHAIQDRSLTTKPSIKMNGNHVNGIRDSTTSIPRPLTKTISNGITVPKSNTVSASFENVSDSSPMSPPLTNGRKRKKP